MGEDKNGWFPEKELTESCLQEDFDYKAQMVFCDGLYYYYEGGSIIGK